MRFKSGLLAGIAGLMVLSTTTGAAMREQNATPESEKAGLKNEFSEALGSPTELSDLKRDLVVENASLKSELQRIRETSADALRISKENRKFREQMISLRSDVERLRNENEALHSRREGMTIGALIMIGGVIIGLVLPMLGGRRRHGSWDTL